MTRDQYIDSLLKLRRTIDEMLLQVALVNSESVEPEFAALAKAIVADIESTSKIGDEQLQANLDKSNQQMQSVLHPSGAESA